MSNQALDDFLVWFRCSTEATWENYETTTLEKANSQGVAGSFWQGGTVWKSGLSAIQIDAIETKVGIRFPPDFRAFLSILNGPDREQTSFRFSNEHPNQLVHSKHHKSFYDWSAGGSELKNAFAEPLEGLVYSVENSAFWLPSWGERPLTSNDRVRKLTDLVKEAPPLIPIFGHRYLVGHPIKSGNPILSVYGSDIIVYGPDLKSYLLVEFYDLLGNCTHSMPDSARVQVVPKEVQNIPFWGEFL